MKRRRPHPAQLELQWAAPAGPDLAPEEPLWVTVDRLNARTLQVHRERRKLLRPKRRQVELLCEAADD